MPSLPQPPSKRRTQARMDTLDELYYRLLSDKRLAQIRIISASPEHDLCAVVQEALDDFVRDVFHPRSLRKVTWGQQTGGDPIPRVEIGSHYFSLIMTSCAVFGRISNRTTNHDIVRVLAKG